MLQIENTTDKTLIETTNMDRHWHLHPMMTQDHDRATTPQTLRRQRIRHAQYAAVRAVQCKP